MFGCRGVCVKNEVLDLLLGHCAWSGHHSMEWTHGEGGSLSLLLPKPATVLGATHGASNKI